MEHLNLNTNTDASVGSGQALGDALRAAGRFHAVLRDENGNIVHEEFYSNTVTDIGAKAMLDNYLAGSSYTGNFYLGLISSASFVSAPVAGDTAGSHANWVEAGGANAPAYSATTRPNCTWSAATGAGAGSRTKSLSAPVSFTFTSAGTVKGSFINTASSKDTAAGVLFSAGLFSGGDVAVQANYTLQVSYQLSL